MTIIQVETRGRTNIKISQTKQFKDLIYLYNYRTRCKVENYHRYGYTKIKEEFAHNLLILSKQFKSTMPYSLKLLVDNRKFLAEIQELKILNDLFDRTNVGHINYIRYIEKLLFKAENKSLQMCEFDTYEEEEPSTCPVCIDEIHKHTPVYNSKCCKKPWHSHCHLYLANKKNCPLCRGKM